MGNRPRILFVVNVDWFFLSHRLAMALAARDRGAEVLIAAADTGQGGEIRREGLRFLPIPLTRTGTNLARELRLLGFLRRTYRSIRPDLVHQVTIKPVIYGSLAARMAGVKAIVNAVSGLGYSFSTDGRAAVLRPLTKLLYKTALRSRGSCTVFQNPDDREDFIRMGLAPAGQTVVIRGSGVDCSKFQATPQDEGSPVVIYAGRMLWDKGVGVLIEAARRLRSSHPDTRFILVGGIDVDNPMAIPEDRIRIWADDGIVQWWGERRDMPDVMARAHVVTLPSTHREGLPKVLLEAAASGRPIVATDVPGCREIVRHDVNGLLVPAGDSGALAEGLQKLLDAPELRRRFGQAGREIVEREFSQEIIVEQTLELYRRLLGAGRL